MSFAVWNWMKVYARWREKYLASRDAWKFPLPEEPIITLAPKGEKIVTDIKNKGIWVALAILALLALSRDSK